MILDAKTIKNGTKLVKLRNPHGKNEWKGSYSDGSKEMSKAVEKEMGMDNEDDGTFCMTYDDFHHFFHSSFITHYEEGLHYQCIPQEHDNGLDREDDGFAQTSLIV